MRTGDSAKMGVEPIQTEGHRVLLASLPGKAPKVQLQLFPY